MTDNKYKSETKALYICSGVPFGSPCYDCKSNIDFKEFELEYPTLVMDRYLTLIDFKFCSIARDGIYTLHIGKSAFDIMVFRGCIVFIAKESRLHHGEFKIYLDSRSIIPKNTIPYWTASLLFTFIKKE